jgi:hypothetical protein
VYHQRVITSKCKLVRHSLALLSNYQ